MYIGYTPERLYAFAIIALIALAVGYARHVWPIMRRAWAHFKALPTEETVDELLAEQVNDKLAGRLAQKLSDGMITRILDKLPSAVATQKLAERARLEEEIEDLTHELETLREQQWRPIGVHMRGLKRDGEENVWYFAVVEVNPLYGGIRAPLNPDLRKIVEHKNLSERSQPFYEASIKTFMIGAPNYTKVGDSDKQVVMLGETYTFAHKPTPKPEQKAETATAGAGVSN